MSSMTTTWILSEIKTYITVYTKISDDVWMYTFAYLLPPFIYLLPLLKLLIIQIFSSWRIQWPNAQVLTTANEVEQYTLRIIRVRASVFFVKWKNLSGCLHLPADRNLEVKMYSKLIDLFIDSYPCNKY